MTEISRERRAELRQECEPPISGTHKPVAYWELCILLDIADERDELRAEGERLQSEADIMRLWFVRAYGQEYLDHLLYGDTEPKEHDHD